MDEAALVPVLAMLIAFFGTFALLILRWRKIKRYGVGGGEFNHPLATIGYGGVAPGTAIQEDFGGVATTQPQSAAGTADLSDDRKVVIRRKPDDSPDEPGSR